MSARAAQKTPPKGSQSRPKAGPARPSLKVTLDLPPPSTSVLRVKSRPRPGEGPPAHQLPGFKQSVCGWASRLLGTAAKEIRPERGWVLSPDTKPELCFELVIPDKLRPEVEALLKNGHVTLAPGPWPQETLAFWKDEYPRCTVRAFNIPHNMSNNTLSKCLTGAGYRVESVTSERDPDCPEFCRASAAIVTFAASKRKPPETITVSSTGGVVTCVIKLHPLQTDWPLYSEGGSARASGSYAAAAAGGGRRQPAAAEAAAAAEQAAAAERAAAADSETARQRQV